MSDEWDSLRQRLHPRGWHQWKIAVRCSRLLLKGIGDCVLQNLHDLGQYILSEVYWKIFYVGAGIMGMFGKYECGHVAINKWSVGDRLSLRSMTRRTGERPYQLRTLREGLSSSAVRVPTSMAACSARFLCTIMEVNGVDRTTGLPPLLCNSMKPSADSAHFRVIYGRRKVWKVMKRLMRCRHSFSNTPTVTSRPASFNFCIPRPATLEKGPGNR